MGQKSRTKKNRPSTPKQSAPVQRAVSSRPSLVSSSASYVPAAARAAAETAALSIGVERRDVNRILVLTGTVVIILIALLVLDQTSDLPTRAGQAIAGFTGF